MRIAVPALLIVCSLVAPAAASAQTLAQLAEQVNALSAEVALQKSRVSKLTTEVNQSKARLAKLEGTATLRVADLAGTYAVQTLQTELKGGGVGAANVSVYSGSGRIELRADGTGSLTGYTEKGHLLRLGTGQASRIDRAEAADTFNWSVVGGVITLYGSTFQPVAGGRLLVRTSTNPADGTNVALMLVRTAP